MYLAVAIATLPSRHVGRKHPRSCLFQYPQLTENISIPTLYFCFVCFLVARFSIPSDYYVACKVLGALELRISCPVWMGNAFSFRRKSNELVCTFVTVMNFTDDTHEVLCNFIAYTMPIICSRFSINLTQILTLLLTMLIIGNI